MLGLYSGLINLVAKSYAACFKPDLWHSITVDVKIGTISNKKRKLQVLTDNEDN